MSKKEPDSQIGNQYGRPDIERLGLFVEMPYMNGKKYVSPFPKPAKAGLRNIMGEGPKSRCGTLDGYFDSEFRRLFIGEGLNWKKPKKKEKKKTGGAPFLPPSNPEMHSSPGDYYGCFSGNISAFGTGYKFKPKAMKKKKEPPNFMIGATKLGGYGYADVGLSPYPEHFPDPKYPKKKKQKNKKLGASMIPTHYPQPYFNPNPYVDADNPTFVSTYKRPSEKPRSKAIWVPTGPPKWDGGCKAGTLSPFPEWVACKYVPLSALDKPKKGPVGMRFYPQSMGDKSLWYFSIVNRKTDFTVNEKNYDTIEPSYTNYLVI